MTDDGSKIAIGRMRPATRDALRTAFTDPEFQNEFGLRPVAAGEPEADNGIDSTSLAAILYTSCSTLMVGLAQRSGYTREQAGVLAFTPDEINALAPTTAKVLQKYLPTGKYQDELMLGLMLTSVISGKLALLRKSAAVVTMVPRPAATDAASAASQVVGESQ